ncbi:MAG: sugar transferase [Acidimicrobiales bacterium]|nr:sugar transferase [Acidimicrobiales bacterium]MDG1878656.1 sugar transferase [Acidimicrobiales bacterium]
MGFRFLHVIDAITLFAALHLVTALRFGFDWPTFSYPHYVVGFTLATLILLTVYYFGGLYEYEQRLGRPPWLPKASVLTGVAVLLSAGVALSTGRYLMPRGNLVGLFVAATFIVSINRWVARRVRSRRFGVPRVLLVGTPDDIVLAESHLDDTGASAEVAGHVPNTTNLIASIEGMDATDVLLLGGESLEEIYPAPLDELEQRLIGVYRRVLPVDTLLGLQRSREIAGMPFVALRTHAVPTYRLRLKRLLDLLFLLLAAPIALVVLGVAALYVRFRVGRGIIYHQERVGHRGRIFTLYKFRSMIPDAEARTGAVAATTNDDRVAPGMRWIRASRIDELPQLWNVARGEMSLVGPRPERPTFVAQFEELLPGYGRRHDIPPGITGLAQIRGHYQTDPGFKLGHDLQYIVNWSPILDLLILAQTIGVIVRRSGR